MKDLFSGHAGTYAAFRPDYPDALYHFLLEHTQARSFAWDCATGNGQAAKVLAQYFDKVHATDISEKQIQHAPALTNITYTVCPAEQTPFPDHHFDLITVGQALHWFDRTKFYEEVRRIARPNALLAAWGYGLLSVTPAIDQLISDFYAHMVGPYWDSARKLVETSYKTIPFPFREIEPPRLAIEQVWNIGTLEGYLNTWSATQQYIKANRHNPVGELIQKIANAWPAGETMPVSFPLFMRAGYV